MVATHDYCCARGPQPSARRRVPRRFPRNRPRTARPARHAVLIADLRKDGWIFRGAAPAPSARASPPTCFSSARPPPRLRPAPARGHSRRPGRCNKSPSSPCPPRNGPTTRPARAAGPPSAITPSPASKGPTLLLPRRLLRRWLTERPPMWKRCWPNISPKSRRSPPATRGGRPVCRVGRVAIRPAVAAGVPAPPPRLKLPAIYPFA